MGRLIDDLKPDDKSYDAASKLARLAKAQGLNTDDENEGVKSQATNVPGICRTCAHSTIYSRGSAEHKETTVRCGMLGKIVPHDIMECTDYWRRGQMTLREAHELAWYIDARPLPGGNYR